MRAVYNLSIRVYTLLIYLSALRNPKARLWVAGRKQWRTQLRKQIAPHQDKRKLWLHAASLGEFEQGRPLIENWRERYPSTCIVLTFFSPSGFEVRKNYSGADLIFYLPPDTSRNAKDFIEILRPEVALFVRNEFWFNYLRALRHATIPTYLLSATFRNHQPFFKWYGKSWRSILPLYTHIFVQDDQSSDLLNRIGCRHHTLVGDMRVDRVRKIAATANEDVLTRNFKAAGDGLVMVAGSTWKADEEIFLSVLSDPKWHRIRLVVAPHDTSIRNVQRLEKSVKPWNPVRYSQGVIPAHCRCLIIDNIGLLNQLYRYADIAFIGGGFGKSIHNILEPAAWGVPVVFGPRHEKFPEAFGLQMVGGGFSIRNPQNFESVIEKLVDEGERLHARDRAGVWVQKNEGATVKTMQLLTDKWDKIAGNLV